MVHKVPWDKNNYFDKARVFIEIKSQFSKLFKLVKVIVDNNSTVSDSNRERSSINIAYLILFLVLQKLHDMI